MAAVSTSPAKEPSARFMRKREEILDRSVAVFNRMGVRGATLADVAAEVDLNLTSIRHYFARREDLVAALVESSMGSLVGITAGCAQEPTPDKRVRALVRNYFELRRKIRTGEVRDTIHFADVRTMKPPHSDRIWPIYTDMFRAIRSVVCTPDELKTGDRQQLNARTQVVVAQLIRSVFWLPEYQIEDFDRVEARFADILLNGLAADREGWSPRLVELPEEDKPEKRSLESFLHAATQTINVQGYRGASVERIAARLNVTKGSFYHHANAKDDLVAACCDRTFRLMSDAQRLALGVESRGLDQAGVAIATLVRLQQTDRGPLLRNSALTSMVGETRERMTEWMDRVANRFADMVADGIIDGSARPCDPRIAGHMLMATVNSAEEVGRWVAGFGVDNVVPLYARLTFVGLFR
jgi:AcrR family transcriptional regulator